MSEEMIPVFDRDNRYVCDVEIVTNLDNYDTGYTYIPGAHGGIARIQDGRYVFMLVSQWQGDYSWGDIVTPAEALWLVFDSGNEHLLRSEFPDLEYQVRNTLLVPRPGQRLPRYLIH